MAITVQPQERSLPLGRRDAELEGAQQSSLVVFATSDTLQRRVSQALGESPFDVIYTRTPVECLASVETVRPVLVIVECDGASSLPVLLDRLRANSSAQVMLIGPDADQGLGALEMGIGVDYVKSPVRETELRARVRRHATRGVEQETLRFGELSIDPVARSVRLAGKLVHLKALEFDLLKFLASRAGSLFTRRELLEHVWGPYSGGSSRCREPATTSRAEPPPRRSPATGRHPDNHDGFAADPPLFFGSQRHRRIRWGRRPEAGAHRGW
jgi:two-component system KDP operon response regulator KdpE